DEQLSDPALLRQEVRKLSALSIRVWDAAQPQLEKLVRRRTGELALLIQALVNAVRRPPMRSRKPRRWRTGHRWPGAAPLRCRVHDDLGFDVQSAASCGSPAIRGLPMRHSSTRSRARMT